MLLAVVLIVAVTALVAVAAALVSVERVVAPVVDYLLYTVLYLGMWGQ